MENKHRIGAVRTCYTIECGNCKHRWSETSTNSLRNNFDPGIQEGDYLECPQCKEELATDFEYINDM